MSIIGSRFVAEPEIGHADRYSVGHVYGRLSYHHCDNGLAAGSVIALARAGSPLDYRQGFFRLLSLIWLESLVSQLQRHLAEIPTLQSVSPSVLARCRSDHQNPTRSSELIVVSEPICPTPSWPKAAKSLAPWVAKLLRIAAVSFSILYPANFSNATERTTAVFAHREGTREKLLLFQEALI